LERGLTLYDFEILTFGMIIDFIIEYNNRNDSDGDEEQIIEATQAHFDVF